MGLLLVLGRAAALPPLWVGALLVASYAFASRFEFEVGSALAIPTQLVFVEMMFLLPAAQLPLWIVVASLLGMVPEALRGAVPAERLLVVIGSSWFAFGPAVVLT